MSSRVMLKVILFIVGVLVLVQLLFYNSVKTANIERARDDNLRMNRQVESLSVDKQELEKYLAGLQKEYEDIIASVPPRILQGYDDYEVILASFLDYLKSSELKSVDARVALQGAKKYINKPVPLFEHDMTFNISFKHLDDARKFLAFILEQEEYPLIVHSFELRSSGDKKIAGTLQASLLIPVRQQEQLFDREGTAGI